jgi:hypothetical protein
VYCGEILVRIVACEAELRHRTSELEGLGTPVWIMAGRATVGGGRVGALSFHQRFHVPVAREAQIRLRRAEQGLLGRHVRLMTLDAAPALDRSVHRALAELSLEVGVTGKAQLGSFDG